MSKKKRAPLPQPPEPMGDSPCTCPACTPEPLGNPRDFAVEGDVRIVRAHGGAPVFLVDDVALAELVRFHFKPEETCVGYRLGRVQVVIVPVRE